MVKIINPPIVTPVTATPKTRTAGVQPHTDERRAEPKPTARVERRKNPDRRRQSSERPLYDMRGRRGRRKTDLGYSPIDVDA